MQGDDGACVGAGPPSRTQFCSMSAQLDSDSLISVIVLKSMLHTDAGYTMWLLPVLQA